MSMLKKRKMGLAREALPNSQFPSDCCFAGNKHDVGDRDKDTGRHRAPVAEKRELAEMRSLFGCSSKGSTLALLAILVLTVCAVASLLHGAEARSTSWGASSRRRSRWNRELECPKECECRDSSRKMDCTYRALNYIPRGIAKDVKRL